MGLMTLPKKTLSKLVNSRIEAATGNLYRYVMNKSVTHSSDRAMTAEPGRPHRHSHAATLIGILHGLAGSSHIWGVLPALAFGDTAGGVAYLVSFGSGTIAGMACFSSVIGWIGSGFSLRGMRVHRALLTGSSIAAIVVGAYWLAS